MKLYKNKKAISAGLIAILIILAIVALGVTIYYMGVQLNWWGPPSPEEPFHGTMAITVEEEDTFNKTDPSTTSPKYYAYHTHGKSLSEMTAADFIGGVSFTAGTAKDFTIDADDVGLIVFWLYGGSAHYVDVDATLAANGWSEWKDDVDVNGDKKDDYIFLADVGAVGVPGQAAKPAKTFIAKLAWADVDAGTTMADTSDKTSVGAGTKTTTITWEVSGFVQERAVAISRVYITHGNNITNEDLAIVKSVSVSYSGGWPDNEVVCLRSDDTLTYDSGGKTWWMYGSGESIMQENRRQVVDSIVCFRAEGGAEKISITATVETYFGGSDVGVTLTCYCDLIKPDNSVYTTSLSDAVKVQK